MTPRLSKLIKAFKIYNWKKRKNSLCFLINFWMFSSVSKKAHCCKVPPFNVLHHIFCAPIWSPSYTASMCQVFCVQKCMEYFTDKPKPWPYSNLIVKQFLYKLMPCLWDTDVILCKIQIFVAHHYACPNQRNSSHVYWLIWKALVSLHITELVSACI